MTIESIREQVLKLPPGDRAELAEALLSSLDEMTESEIEALWVDEVQRRGRELDEGVVEAIPADVVRREAQALLKR
jgi:putative addiction module component (TIGR02574 family)